MAYIFNWNAEKLCIGDAFSPSYVYHWKSEYVRLLKLLYACLCTFKTYILFIILYLVKSNIKSIFLPPIIGQVNQTIYI